MKKSWNFSEVFLVTLPTQYDEKMHLDSSPLQITTENIIYIHFYRPGRNQSRFSSKCFWSCTYSHKCFQGEERYSSR